MSFLEIGFGDVNCVWTGIPLQAWTGP